jgi:hypothetical protein
LIRHSRVRAEFEKLGYATVTFKNYYPSIDIPDSDYYFDYYAGATDKTSLDSLNFQYLFLRTTALRPVVEWLEASPNVSLPAFWASWIPVNSIVNGRDYLQYLQNKYALDMLETIPDLPGRKFVYAHLFIVHQPFVFYPDGRFHPALKQDVAAYRDQVLHANMRLLDIVKTILAKSAPDPIIILQGDHSYAEGPDRVKILNAYYLPGGGARRLYSSVTPVNTFRILFNEYFGGRYELLPDVSWYRDDRKQLQEAPPTCVEVSKP